MLSRRSFLLSAGAVALGQLASGCSSGDRTVLNVRLLKNSIPPQLLEEFRQQLEQSVALKFKPEAQLEDLFSHLQTLKQASAEEANPGSLPFGLWKKPAIADFVTLGDYWLASAIQEKLIQPLNVQQLSGWQKLPLRWQKLVKRNQQGEPDDNGAIWGAPYRWGSTVIAYHRDRFEALGWTPTDWSDLWRPELRDRISMLDQPREVIGLTLKKLGFSYNTSDLKQVPNLTEELLALRKQVKFYSSDAYLQPLILEDIWLAVGWSTDILAVQARYPKIEAVVPRSGTALWTDLWVQPTPFMAEANSIETGNQSSLTKQWIDFCWQDNTASKLYFFSRAASPIILKMNPNDLSKDIRENPLLLPDAQILENSDFLFPLSPPTLKQYKSLWQEIRDH